MSAASNLKKTALVLGGGGPLGIAWEAGMLQGWADWAQPDADLLAIFRSGRIVGTSAGAIVGAHLAAHGLVSKLFRQQSEPLEPDTPKSLNIARFLAALFKAKLFTRNLLHLRQSVGKSALKAALPGQQLWLETIARSYAPAGPWPAERDLLIPVINAETGEFHAWNAGSGVPLALAIAASCAVPCAFPLVSVNGHMYMDGGIGSPTNATLAEGCAYVLVLDPIGGVLGKASPLGGERRQLEAGGSRTLAFLPDSAVTSAIGNNFLDMSRRTKVAALAHAQGLATAADVWSFLQNTAAANANAAQTGPAAV